METHWIPFSYSLKIIIVEQVFRYSISVQCWDGKGLTRWQSIRRKKKRCQSCWGGAGGWSGEKHCGFTLASQGHIHQLAVRLSALFERTRLRRHIGVRRLDCFQDDVTRLPSNPSVIRVSHKDSRRRYTAAATSAFLTDWRWFFHLSELSHPLDSSVSEGFEPPAGWMGG